MWPPEAAASQVRWSQGHPAARHHRTISRCPARAAPAGVIVSHEQPQSQACCTALRLPQAAAMLIVVQSHRHPQSRAHSRREADCTTAVKNVSVGLLLSVWLCGEVRDHARRHALDTPPMKMKASLPKKDWTVQIVSSRWSSGFEFRAAASLQEALNNLLMPLLLSLWRKISAAAAVRFISAACLLVIIAVPAVCRKYVEQEKQQQRLVTICDKPVPQDVHLVSVFLFPLFSTEKSTTVLLSSTRGDSGFG